MTASTNSVSSNESLEFGISYCPSTIFGSASVIILYGVIALIQWNSQRGTKITHIVLLYGYTFSHFSAVFSCILS